MNKEWANSFKKFQVEISKSATFTSGINTLLSLRENLFNALICIKKDISLEQFSLQPFINRNGYESKTIIYSIYHLVRIEDIVCNTIIRNEEQIFFLEGFDKSTNSPIITTGNELKGNEIAEFSKKLNIDEVYKYLEAVYKSSNEYIQSLNFADLKIKFDDDVKQRVINTKTVSEDETANWLISYWCDKNILGLLKMPFSRHYIMHIEASLRIKNKISK